MRYLLYVLACAVLSPSINPCHASFYWQVEGAQMIRRVNLDGSNVQDLVAVSRGGTGLALDLSGRKIY